MNAPVHHYRGLDFTSVGPFPMRPHICMAPAWVMTYGLRQLRERLAAAGVTDGVQQSVYIKYFQGLWERRNPKPPAGSDPEVIRQVQAFTDELRQTKRSIFGE